jgi:DNA replication and repair protein RecF
MHLAELELEEFRAYRRLQLQLAPAGLRLVGDNASGKSTLLEAIAMLATTRSTRTSSERELINWQSGDELAVPPFARVRGGVRRRDRTVEVEIGLQIEPGRPTHVKKLIRVNGRPARAVDAVGALNAVLFSPEDIDLISGSPAGRRRYLDVTISQLDPAYLRALSRYGRVLEQRNSLVKSLAAAGGGLRSRSASEQLGFWDAELIAHGAAITARRHLVIGRLRTLAGQRFADLAGRADFTIDYSATVPVPPLGQLTSIVYSELLAVVARNYELALRDSRDEEFRRGATLIGPHRDDLEFRLGDLDIGPYGSRGQQRLAILALKLAITTQMTETAGEPPVLMLDDVLSELDATHRAWVLAAAAEAGAQIIVTATDATLLRQPSLDHLPIARVVDGSIAMAELE